MKELIGVILLLGVLLGGCIDSNQINDVRNDTKIELQIINITNRHSEAHLLDRASDYISITYINNNGEIDQYDFNMDGYMLFIERHIYLTNQSSGKMIWYYHKSASLPYRYDIYIPESFFK